MAPPDLGLLSMSMRFERDRIVLCRVAGFA